MFKSILLYKTGRLDLAYCRIEPPSGAEKGATPYVPKNSYVFKNFYIVNKAA
jgi:hypothetical protein